MDSSLGPCGNCRIDRRPRGARIVRHGDRACGNRRSWRVGSEL